MNRSIMRIMAGALALAGATVASVEAEAMPVQSLAPAVTTGTAVEKAYLVCGPFRCFRRGWGWRRPYYGWHRRYGWRRW